MREIEFFLIGAPKTGSYSLWYYLSKHPELCLSIDKEPHIFSREDTVEIDRLIDEQFKHCKQKQKCVEASLYLQDRGDAERIYNKFPQAKFIVSMRDPIDRLISNYQYRKSRGDEKRSFEEILENGEAEDLITGSLYSKNLKNFIKYFSKSHFLFVSVENFNLKFEQTLKNIFEFLEVDKNVKIQNEGKLNVTMPKGNFLNLIFEWNRGSRSWNRPNTSKTRKSILPKNLLNYFSNRGLIKEKSDREHLREMIFDKKYSALVNRFQEDKNELEKDFNLDLSCWINLN